MSVIEHKAVESEAKKYETIPSTPARRGALAAAAHCLPHRGYCAYDRRVIALI